VTINRRQCENTEEKRKLNEEGLKIIAILGGNAGKNEDLGLKNMAPTAFLQQGDGTRLPHNAIFTPVHNS
jgi:hypothetical protein